MIQYHRFLFHNSENYKMTKENPIETLIEFMKNYDEQHRISIQRLTFDEDMIIAPLAEVIKVIGVPTKSLKRWGKQYTDDIEKYFIYREYNGKKTRCINTLLFDFIQQNNFESKSIRMTKQVMDAKKNIDARTADIRRDAHAARVEQHKESLNSILDNLDNTEHDVKAYLAQTIATVLATAEQAIKSLENAINDVALSFGAVVELRAVQQCILNTENDWSILLDPKLRTAKAQWLKDPLLKRRIDDEFEMLYGLVMTAQSEANQERLSQHSKLCKDAIKSAKTHNCAMSPELREQLQMTLLYYSQMRVTDIRKYNDCLLSGVMQSDFMKTIQNWIDKQTSLSGNLKARDVIEKFTRDHRALVAEHRKKLQRTIPNMDAEELEKNALIAANANIIDIVNAGTPLSQIKQAIADMRDIIYKS